MKTRPVSVSKGDKLVSVGAAKGDDLVWHMV